jgi:hypothetical protein
MVSHYDVRPFESHCIPNLDDSASVTAEHLVIFDANAQQNLGGGYCDDLPKIGVLLSGARICNEPLS